MEAPGAHPLSDRYTDLSDRFRSLWTFYQFLGGVFKHRGNGEFPYSYDFQGLYRQLQELVPRISRDDAGDLEHELDHVDRELGRIRIELAKIERDFAPSILRRFFDHLKRQDEKILYALVKFYLQSPETLDPDTLDKLDILLTRLSEAPLDDGRVLLRDRTELESAFERLADFAGLERPPARELRPTVDTVRSLREDLEQIDDFQRLVDSKLYDRFRELKRDLGAAILNPIVLLEVVATNISAKNRFKSLYQDEEVRILEDTNRVFEIERYIDKNPDLAHDELRRQIERFRASREKFDSRRRDDNVKREDILELREAMHAVLETFDPSRAAVASARGTAGDPEPLVREIRGPVDESTSPAPDAPAKAAEPPPPQATPPAAPEPADEPARPSTTSIVDLLPADPLLNETLHKIVFALELVVWDRDPEQAVQSSEIHRLQLEPWEVDSYRVLVQESVPSGTLEWHLHLFFLTSAALRVRMQEESGEIERLRSTGRSDRLVEMLERSSQSLERAREVERRFDWFVDDMLYRGATSRLEEVFRSRFRFLHAYSTLWLGHQDQGGITPL
jgi:hypothetical protein